MNYKLFLGPVLGAAIGYFTNYLAVKMLFYPRKEVYLFGKKLPFTPGAIPKGKPRLAKAVGNIVAGSLLTKDDLKERLNSPDLKGKIIKNINEKMSISIKEAGVKLAGSKQDFENSLLTIQHSLSMEVVDTLKKIDIGKIIAEEGSRILKEKTEGTMISMFISDELIQSFTEPIGSEIERFIDERGYDYVSPVVTEKIDDLTMLSISQIGEKFEISQDRGEKLISEEIDYLFEKYIDIIFEKINIAEIVEEKINSMDVIELEKMVLEVMKNELDTIVNLGALIGFILGLLNILINIL
ncbi:Uncharacterized membrane protein YheB, UPF0754 family [Acetitomaculum ruminis DSM 5522]|uniref:Uncharacterized membrane protein YheB, UPF0754 family n=1 Tax=Acetitomaculum ruminis DSM 5522 TaxID=1120918 RepID=A0A1I0UZQ0_9FIRM|nr:DUF445 family protein [Acetitomaculum ruminis]SFA69574.1 Uncharacterized membrane protein YheB, UPF0754 family [Acetitomaculum ruminis DSM 5522]